MTQDLVVIKTIFKEVAEFAEKVHSILESHDGGSKEKTILPSLIGIQSSGLTKKKRRKSKDKKERRFPSAYNVFVRDQRHNIVKSYPDATFSEINILLGDGWKKLTEEEKGKYFTLAHEEKQKAAAAQPIAPPVSLLTSEQVPSLPSQTQLPPIQIQYPPQISSQIPPPPNGPPPS